MKAIVYTSNTGSTACYAKMLSQKIAIPVYSMEEAVKKVESGSEILYLGWIMAGKIKGYEKAAKKYKIKAVCGVGMGQSGTQLTELREKNKIPETTQLFTLQGNFDMKKLRGAYKMMMSIMVKTAGKALANKQDRTPEEDDMLDMIINGKKRVTGENLNEVLWWYDSL